MKFIILILALVSCHPKKTNPDPISPTPEIVDLYYSSIDRLINMLSSDYVVSRWDNGATEHVPDSMIWTGTTLAVIPCYKGNQIEGAMLSMVDHLDGGLWRHPTLPMEISLDGALGFMRGVAKRIMKCPGSRERWGVALAKHLALGKLNPHTDQTWPLEFSYVPELALAVATDHPVPDPVRLVTLTGQITAWAAAVVSNKAACFRLNLGYQAMRTIEELGGTVNNGNFCALTKDAGIATIDRWCGREQNFIANFKYDEWEFHPQRCAWESEPDGKPGLHTPAVDLIEMIYESYTIPEG